MAHSEVVWTSRELCMLRDDRSEPPPLQRAETRNRSKRQRTKMTIRRAAFTAAWRKSHKPAQAPHRAAATTTKLLPPSAGARHLESAKLSVHHTNSVGAVQTISRVLTELTFIRRMHLRTLRAAVANTPLAALKRKSLLRG